MSCDCNDTVNAQLAIHNAHLVTTLFGVQKAVIQTAKMDSKKRGQPPAMIASHCPFCGVAYGQTSAPRPPRPPGAVVVPEDGQTVATPEQGRPIITRENPA